ncbi:MAG: FeoC-like transcriptional regulator [Lachnospiraceae bacterium]|nr:FeoC-like transcriptional regulator [Lachnospiraceae bacterium]
MAVGERLFGNYKECEYCKRPLPIHYEHALCPNCLDAQLFHEVKEFIRSNNVNEYEVAEHFGIPIKQVKAWIREGRIEYRTSESGGAISMHCQRCGSPVSFGTLCPKCLKLLNGNKGVSMQKLNSGDSKMRYLDNENEGQ